MSIIKCMEREIANNKIKKIKSMKTLLKNAIGKQINKDHSQTQFNNPVM